jgi:hypothetical protein
MTNGLESTKNKEAESLKCFQFIAYSFNLCPFLERVQLKIISH